MEPFWSKNLIEKVSINATPLASPQGGLNKIFLGFWTSKKIKMCICKKICVFLQMFAILANVDLDLRLNMYYVL